VNFRFGLSVPRYGGKKKKGRDNSPSSFCGELSYIAGGGKGGKKKKGGVSFCFRASHAWTSKKGRGQHHAHGGEVRVERESMAEKERKGGEDLIFLIFSDF